MPSNFTMIQKIILSVLLFTALFAEAQNTHPCADMKAAMPNFQPVASKAQRSAEDEYDVKFHHLNINVERTTKAISGNVRTVAEVVSPQMDSFAFELYNTLTIDSVLQNNQPINFKRNGNEAKAVLQSPILQGNNVDVTIFYHGTPPTVGGVLGDGFSNASSPSWGNQATWSLSQPYGAYHWWPCKQALQDKIDSSWVFVTTDSSNMAGSNGVLTNVVNLPNGKKRFEWKSHHFIDYYLISVSVAQYVEKNSWAHPVGSTDSVLIQNFIYNNPATYTKFKGNLDTLPIILELLSKLYGPYPFADEKYGHCMAPVSGGMEHQTMTTQGFFEFTINAHEMGHQWFGDNVTCASWKDIFVNEAFASYTEYLALENLVSLTSAKSQMLDVHNNVMSKPGGSIWFTDTTNARIFDSRLTYDKGSAFLHMIRFELNNDSVFFKVLKNYQQQYRNGTASSEDFKNVLEAISGDDFTQFFDQWFYGEGYPTFSINYNFNGKSLVMNVTETVSSTTPFFITPIEYTIKRTGAADTLIRVIQDGNFSSYVIPMSGTDITGITVDPNNWILNKVGSITKDVSLTSIQEAEANDFVVIYPNPVTDKLKITHSFKTENVDVEIYDALGRLVKRETHFQKEMDVQNLDAAMYTVVVRTNDKAIKQRFVKQ